MAVEVIEASGEDRTVVRRLLQFYHYDFSEFDDADVDSHGEFLHRWRHRTEKAAKELCAPRGETRG